MREFKILVADDDLDDYQTIVAAFNELGTGQHISHVDNGQELLRTLNSAAQSRMALPDVVILDINMPLMDGITVIAEIKKNPLLDAIPLIMYSTCSEMEQMRKCYMLGADGYFTKGWSFKQVVAFAERIIDFLQTGRQTEKENKFSIIQEQFKA
jgi:CheY-like chemotaxis protein